MSGRVGRPTSNGHFWIQVGQLPDRIALAVELTGRPVVVPDPGTEHGRKLLAVLGVAIEKPRP